VNSARYKIYSKSCANTDKPCILCDCEPTKGIFCRNCSALVRQDGALPLNGAPGLILGFHNDSHSVLIYSEAASLRLPWASFAGEFEGRITHTSKHSIYPISTVRWSMTRRNFQIMPIWNLGSV